MLTLRPNIISTSAIAATTLSALFGFPLIAKSQIQYSPLTIQLNAEQGQAKGIIELTNRGQTPFRGRVSAEYFTYDKTGFVSVKSGPQDLTPYLTFSPNELVIQPGQTRRIRFISQFLPSTPQGEYRSVLFTEGLEEIQQKGQYNVGIKPRFGITVYVRQGETSQNLVVKSASFDPQIKQIELLVNNTGTATAISHVVWSVEKEKGKSVTGETKDFTVITQGERNILIDSFAGNSKIVPGTYKLTGKLLWGDKENPQSVPFDLNLTISPEQASAANKPSSSR